MSQPVYDDRFFDQINDLAARSAAICVPLILETLAPRSVIDFGCGQGHWLREFIRQGVEDAVGIDGDYVDPAALVIPREKFVTWDLSRRYDAGRRFDLALSLEVGEHLPAEAASAYVDSLTASATQVVFSAAVPGQGGVHHINEQWPWYWQRLFERRGFVCLDPFRPVLWHRDEVAPYYRQNLFLYADAAAQTDLVQKSYRPVIGNQLTLVHSHILESFTHQVPLWRRLGEWVRSLFSGGGS